ncbi:hypothetical protein CMO89_03440 [Candidatus Woesearchaeota archaeon]|nr:hypothetical protein [Candidatus Woesearchaeota archaeon]|tara:strand:+ start:12850 stop:13488 length:639 start_codon:yes stop_codon:yes gene_type:complete
MTNINFLLQDFFNRNPDIAKARNKDLVNRRALAKYIIKHETLDKNKIEALITALRRFEVKKESEDNLSSLFKEINITTKDNIIIINLEKNEQVLEDLSKVIPLINFSKNETLKIVQGSLSVKLFIDNFNLKKIKDIFLEKNILRIHKEIAELSLIFPEKAIKTKGIISYVTSQLLINDINIIELLTCTPELIIYVEEKSLVKAYESIKRLKT